MLSEFEKKVTCFLKAEDLAGSAKRLLLAVSGGVDSAALLHVMHRFKMEKVLDVEFLCAHMNHQLRGRDADLDEEFVVTEAKKLDIPVITRRLDVKGFARENKLSTETAARQLRIEALSEIARTCSCDAIVTAHQKNDNAETVLQRLARGTGFRGLAGIWPQRVFDDGTKFMRPLLCAGRDEIIAYLKERNLQWRRDHTNADCAHRRNYIRHRLLPELQHGCANSLVERLFELARSAQKLHRLVCARADELWSDLAEVDDRETTLDAKKFLTQPASVKVELIRRSLTQIGCGERDLTQEHYENILQSAERNISGREIELPGGFVVRREYGNLTLCPSAGQAPPHVDGGSVTLRVPGRTRFGENLIEATIHDADSAGVENFVKDKTSCVERFDLQRIKLPLIIRPRQPGDRFVPFGMTSEKKLGKFLTAQRVPQRLRKKVLVVADSEKIIWLWPFRMSGRAKISERTRRILQLQITDLGDRKNSVDAAE